MRQLQLQLRPDQADRVLQLANEHEALDPACVLAHGADGNPWAMLFMNLPNARVGEFVKAVEEEVEDAQVVLIPQGTLPIRTPLEEVAERVRDVSRLSTLELVLAGLQSVGSWKGLVMYALFSGAIGAYGVIFDVSYLLVAAMLINPMGAPAMVSVIGIAVGDIRMFGRGGLRFLVALVVQTVSAMALGFAYAIQVSTATMEQVTSLSVWGVVVALAAGAAGAQAQVQSDRSSMVSGTASGFMVAAALAPPAAVLGLAVPLGRWDYAAVMAFLLLLQFTAINLAGWLALILFGVQPADASTGRGTPGWRTALVGLVVVATGMLLVWQTQRQPRFLKADLSRQGLEIARQAVGAMPEARLLESAARFTRPELEEYEREGMLYEIMVEQTGTGIPRDSLESRIRDAVVQRTRERMPGVVPFVNVTVLPGSLPR
jgi:uncharacterized hydrophobic protein (TIGR00271 family)